MKNVTGILFSSILGSSVRELTTHRCMGAVPVGGRYRLVDFLLSGFTQADIQDVGVVTQNNYQSLMDHLGNGKEWDLARKRSGLIILPPYGRTGGSGIYKGKIEAFAGIMEYINSTDPEYVLAADCDFLANIDYADFYRSHRESGADISVIYKRSPVPVVENGKVSIFQVDTKNRVTEVRINPDLAGEQNVFINVMILSGKLLERIVSDLISRNQFSFTQDVLQAGTNRYHINGYEFKGYVGRFDNLQSYYRTNMDLLDQAVRRELFPNDKPVFTKVRDEAPVRFGLSSQAGNSLLADGCVIEGEVENSVLFRGVKVAKGARIRNCILMQGTVVGANCDLEYVISDKNVTVTDNRVLVGFETYPVFLAKGAIV